MNDNSHLFYSFNICTRSNNTMNSVQFLLSLFFPLHIDFFFLYIRLDSSFPYCDK